MILQWWKQSILSMKMLPSLLIPALKWKKPKPTSKLKSCLIEVLGFFFNYICFKVLIYIYLSILNGLVDVITKNAGENTSLYLNLL